MSPEERGSVGQGSMLPPSVPRTPVTPVGERGAVTTFTLKQRKNGCDPKRGQRQTGLGSGGIYAESKEALRSKGNFLTQGQVPALGL